MTESSIEIKVVLPGGEVATCTLPVLVWNQSWDAIAAAMAASPDIKRVSVIKPAEPHRLVIKDEV
jgi:hypothetical protein